MSDMDKLNAQIEAGVAKSQQRDAALELLEGAIAENLGIGTGTAGEIVIYTGLYDSDSTVQELLADTDIASTTKGDS